MMVWRTGTKNPHTLYLDEGGVSIPQGFVMNPGAARDICAAMNAVDGGRAFWDHVDSGHPAIEREKTTVARLSEALALLERAAFELARQDATASAACRMDVRGFLAGQPASPTDLKYALNFCSMCGVALQCEECAK